MRATTIRLAIAAALVAAFGVALLWVPSVVDLAGHAPPFLLAFVLATVSTITAAAFFGVKGSMAAAVLCSALIAAHLRTTIPFWLRSVGMLYLLSFGAIVGSYLDHLRRSREHFRFLLENANDSVYRVDVATGRLQYISPAIERMVGYTPEELMAMTNDEIEETVHPDDRGCRRDVMSQLVADPGDDLRRTLEYRVRHKSGHYVWLSDSLHAVVDAGTGRVLAIEGVDRDITARIRQERDLRDSEERYRLLVEGSKTVFFFTHDTGGRFTFLSQSVTEVLGMRPEELLGRPYTDLLTGEDLETAIRATEDVLAGGSRRPPYLLRTRATDGTSRILEIVESPITRDGVTVGIQGFASDVTERERSREMLVKGKRRLTALHTVVGQLADCRKADEVYDLAGRAAVDVLGFETCALCVYRDGRFEARVHPASRPEYARFFLEADTGVAGFTFSRGRTYVSGDIRKVRWARKADPSIRSLISAPVGDMGVLQIQSGHVNAFDDDDVRLAEILVSHLWQALRRIGLEAELRHQATHDSTTGLYNRVYFEAELERMASGQLYPISIIAVDIDGLKLINDTLGHSAGDEMLRRCAAILRGTAGAKAMVARTGGDEFAVVLPRTEEAAAEQVALRMRSAVEADNQRHADVPLSASLGMATAACPDHRLEETLRDADNSMYRDKLHRSASARSAIVNALVAALAERDYIAQGHADRIGAMALVLGEALGLSTGEKSELMLLAQIHDIGKVGIPDNILFKPGKLTAAERVQMQRHPEIGYRIIRSSPDMAHVADLILHHHEWWDGSGYPLGLRGESIPIQCRILSVVDAFDAMTNDRPYRKAMQVTEAIEELRRWAGRQFDPTVVDLFITQQVWTEVEAAG